MGNPFATPGQNDIIGEVTGDDWGYGYILGALFQATDKTRLGIGYRSEIDLTLEGDLNVKGTDPVSDGAVAGGAVAGTGGTADLTTPANLNLGVYHQLTDRLALMANAEWTEWSSFDELVVEFEQGSQPRRTGTTPGRFPWAPTTRSTSSGCCAPAWATTRRRSPAVNSARRGCLTPTVPGPRWAPPGCRTPTSVSPPVTCASSVTDMNQDGAKEENATRGNLAGTYEVSANVFALSVDYRF